MSAGEPPINSPEIRRLAPVIEPGHTYGTVTDKISAIVLTRPASFGWFAGFTLAFSVVMLLTVSLAWLITKGVGIWGINIPIGWGFAIVNFVWWIGIGHAGTLISAILFLLNQKWRTSINRFAEAMTLFAVACAGIFPLIHTGRPWMAYYMFPYPSTMGIWPQFRSPLIWDVFAVSTYGTVSLLFWFVGLIPDLATLRDRTVEQAQADHLRHAGHGLARLGAPLAALPIGVFASCRARDAPRAFRAQRDQLRLLGRHRSGLAHHDLPALFRCRRHLLRLCDGSDHRDSPAQGLRPGRFHHHAPPGKHGHGHARHRPDRGVRLLLRIFLVALQRQQVRRIPGPAAPPRPIQSFLFRADPLQHPDAAAPLVPDKSAPTCRCFSSCPSSSTSACGSSAS